MSTVSPVELLQSLIRFNTTNPPGNEAGCISYINNLLAEEGFETTLLARVPERPNLVTRLRGQGNTAPLLLYGHVDVVSTEGQVWKYPPFEGKVADGYVWGRGALDMKGGLAMMVSALLRAKAEGMTPLGDVILALLSDEESGGDYGAKYLVQDHPHLFDGIRYAIGEFGGFPFYLGKHKFYQIQVAEKHGCKIQAIIRGPAGYGSLIPPRGNAIAKLSRFLLKLERQHLPVHITPLPRKMIEALISALPFPNNIVLRQLLNPRLTDIVLRMLGDKGRTMHPLLHNTVNAFVIQGGDRKAIQIPSEVVVLLAVYILPGYSPADVIAELRQVVGEDVELETVVYEPSPAEPDMELFDTLAGILREADPDGIPMPMLLPAGTDGPTFSQLGIQTYGFTPMNLPSGFNFSETTHAADERIPVEALDFGTNAIYKLLQRFGQVVP